MVNDLVVDWFFLIIYVMLDCFVGDLLCFGIVLLGGGDFIVLMYLIWCWVQGCILIVVIVDYGLCFELVYEVWQVGVEVVGLGILYEILLWQCDQIGGNLMVQVCEVWLWFLLDWVYCYDLLVVLLGYMLDDQVEMLLM